ncbi:MAG: DPP IV N-terminal domain-containing protein [Vicinamibacteria bacterium]
MNAPLARVLAAGVLACLAAAAPAGAAELPKLTVERINAQPSLSGTLPMRLAWHPDGRRLTWLRRAGEATTLEALDVKTGQKSVLLDGAKVLRPAPAGSGATKGAEPRPLPLAGARWMPDGNTLLVPAGGDLFTVDVRTGAVRALVLTPEAEEYFDPSPDGTRVAFVRGSDLWVADVATGRQVQLTKTGTETLLNGRLDWVYEEELASRSGQAFEWSPDSRAIAYLQLDQSRVPTFPIVDFLPVRNEVRWQRYPKAGAPNAVVRLGVVGIGPDLAPGRERLASFSPDDVYVMPQIGFTPDSRNVTFELMNRAQNELELRLLPVPADRDAPLGEPKTVLVEKSKTFVNHFGAPRFFDGGRRFLWISERDGYAHVHACDLAGACRPVTKGPWIVDAAVAFAGPAPRSPSTSGRASCTSPPRRRTRGSATCTAPGSTARASRASRRRTARTARSSPRTGSSTRTRGPTCRRRRACSSPASTAAGASRSRRTRRRRSSASSAGRTSGWSSRRRTGRSCTARS